MHSHPYSSGRLYRDKESVSDKEQLGLTYNGSLTTNSMASLYHLAVITHDTKAFVCDTHM